MPVSTEAFELVLIETDGSTTSLPLPEGPAFIGSSSKCSILISDASIAPVHAELMTSTDGAIWIRDLAKRNDTLVNGQPITTSKLEDGAFIKLGVIDLCLRARNADSGTHGTAIRQSSSLPALSAPRPRSGEERSYKPSPSGLNVKPHTSPSGLNIQPSFQPTDHTHASSGSFADGDDMTIRPASRPAQDMIGPGVIVADRYRVISKIAEGGMGEVYKAIHIELEKPVALKVMKQTLGEDAGFAERFKREAVAASRIGQQNICDVSDFGRTATGRFFFVMEFLDGQTLGALIRDRGALPISRAIFVMNQLCHALASAHAQGIVHRDLKPENVMLLQRPGQRDFVKVLDFGVAKVRLGNDSVGTQVGMVVGTPQYMAPEQASGLLTDARTDIYALGLILFEMLQGKPTFNDDTAGLLMAAQIYREPPPLVFSSGDPMPDFLQALVHRMLAKKAENRPQTMEEVLLGLEDCSAKLAAPIAAMATPAMTPPLRPSQAHPGAAKPVPPPKVAGPSSTVHVKPPSGAKTSAIPETAPGTVTDTALDDAELKAAISGGSKGPLIAAAIVLLMAVGAVGFYFFGRTPAPNGVVDVNPPPVKNNPTIEVVKPPVDVKPVDVKPVDVKPLDVKPIDVKPVDVKPVDVKPVDAKPVVTQVKLTLTSTPPGAAVSQGDTVVGKTPLEFSWDKGKKGAFLFQAPGYANETRNIAPLADLALDITLKKEEPGAKGKKPGPGKKGKELLDDPYGNQVQDLQENPY